MAGVPVLASDFPDLRRFITEYGGGMNVDFDDAEALETAITRLVEERRNRPTAERIASLRHALSFNRFLEPLAADILGHCAHPGAGRAG